MRWTLHLLRPWGWRWGGGPAEGQVHCSKILSGGDELHRQTRRMWEDTMSAKQTEGSRGNTEEEDILPARLRGSREGTCHGPEATLGRIWRSVGAAEGADLRWNGWCELKHGGRKPQGIFRIYWTPCLAGVQWSDEIKQPQRWIVPGGQKNVNTLPRAFTLKARGRHEEFGMGCWYEHSDVLCGYCGRAGDYYR